ncbi:septation ring formation regulator EzrA [Ligilactobacillus pobuzihii]|uniref:septation ring formation regulator EzrA n=1 Tax=Ligilactobacillus pobuzihii TaxID=449659 RepID=UPI0019CFD1B0|nr:septation ring formation regulator EzrA [Ligilactobacillus pobuzihii]MBN7275123.1 septation ring formation regulator EzrA [Ligilactobacillus pobuzihii]
MVVFLIAVVVIAVIVYLAILYFQRSYSEAISEEKNNVEKIANDSLEEKLAEISQLNLSGESLTEFETLDKGYHYLKNRELPELSELLNDLTDALHHYQYFRVSRELKSVQKKATGAQQHHNELKTKLAAIKESTKKHEDTLKQLQQKYQELRTTLLNKNFSFGPSIDKLEEKSADIEDDFSKYTEYFENGDFVSSEEPLNKLENDMTDLENAVEEIPPLFKNLNNVFPEQLSELKDGLKWMKDSHLAFNEDLNAKLEVIHKECLENEQNLAELDWLAAKELDEQIANEIDHIYEQIEIEYTAATKINAKLQEMGKFVEHARQQQNELNIELDRLGQNYTFNNDEEERAANLEKTLTDIKQRFEQLKQDKENEKDIHSSTSVAQLEKDQQSLVEIEEEQKQINESISGLWKEEKDAFDAIENFDTEIHRMKREIEKLNLPGLPEDYLSYFFKVSDEIENLDTAINKVKIDMSEITRSMINTQSDLDVLNNKTEEIKDSSMLAEQLLQYSNRYRNRYPEVEQAYQQALVQFKKEFNYVGSLDTISQAVDTVEPGSFKRISEQFESDKQALTL